MNFVRHWKKRADYIQHFDDCPAIKYAGGVICRCGALEFLDDLNQIASMVLPDKPPAVTVMPVGSTVTIGGNIEGCLTAISIRESNYICYEVEYWDGRSRRAEWFAAGQVSQVENRVKIGFATQA